MTHDASLITATWRDQILKEFPADIARLTLGADPDGLLTEESVVAGLRERGFDLITFDDPIAFRYVYLDFCSHIIGLEVVSGPATR
jgi:hypothetical protein